MRKQKGFSLIELLIVVAIILIIAAIAVPNLMRARSSANESSAVGSIRTIVSAEFMYQKDNPTIGYSADLATMGSSGSGQLVDSTLAVASPVKSGFSFNYAPGSGTPVSTFSISAAPQSSATGSHQYCSDQTAVIRVNAWTSGNPPASCDQTWNPIQ